MNNLIAFSSLIFRNVILFREIELARIFDKFYLFCITYLRITRTHTKTRKIRWIETRRTHTNQNPNRSNKNSKSIACCSVPIICSILYSDVWCKSTSMNMLANHKLWAIKFGNCSSSSSESNMEIGGDKARKQSHKRKSRGEKSRKYNLIWFDWNWMVLSSSLTEYAHLAMSTCSKLTTSLLLLLFKQIAKIKLSTVWVATMSHNQFVFEMPFDRVKLRKINSLHILCS